MAQILFCDTNILRYILDDSSRIAPFLFHLREKNLVMTISLIQAIELIKLPHYHSSLADLLIESDARAFPWWKNIISNEVDVYPATNNIDPLSYPSFRSIFNSPQGKNNLASALSGDDLNVLRHEFEDQKRRYESIMKWLPTTIPKVDSAETIDIDFKLHNYGFVLQILREVAPQFVEKIKHEPMPFNELAFPGAYVIAAYIYYRYILKGMKPEPSDTPDLHQVFYTPYCTIVILEKSMAGILHQLKNERGLLTDLEIKSIRYIRSIVG